MKLVTFRPAREGPARLGALENGFVIDLAALGAAAGRPLPATMLELIDLEAPGLHEVRSVLADHDMSWPTGTAFPAENVTVLAPIPRPRKNIFGIGLNYAEHVEESSRSLDTSAKMPDRPVIFSKPPTAVVGPGEPVQHNAALTQQLDWEVELAVIIGKRAAQVPEERAMDHVWGYSILIDISARDNRRAGQWIYSKGMDSYAPFGPCILTADSVDDPHDLNLWLTVNGVEKQNSSTRHMYFKIPALISDLSEGITLEPGDIIATGTPEGVGAGRDPQEWLWPGDVIEAGIDEIGTIRHPVVAAGPAETGGRRG